MTSRFGPAAEAYPGLYEPPATPPPYPALYLLPLDDSFYPPKRIALHPGSARVRVGRQLNQKTTPGAGNGVFESRVLSRQHAEAWVEGDKILIKDVKSSNGTFVNGERLSAEGAESEAFELRSDDILEFGIDIVGEHGEVVHRKVAARVTCAFSAADAQRAVRAEQR
ncbi:SMAD/FHA domain-containing protein, partial [Mycena vulgaris]